MALLDVAASIPSLTLADGIGQLAVRDDSFAGLQRGDRLFTIPCHRFMADDLYVLAGQGEPYGLWRCASTLSRRDPGVYCWKDGRREETKRRLTMAEFNSAVIAQVAGWVHIRDRYAIYEDRRA